MAIYPGGIATNSDLLTAANRATTALSAGIDNLGRCNSGSVHRSLRILRFHFNRNRDHQVHIEERHQLPGCTRGFDGSANARTPFLPRSWLPRCCPPQSHEQTKSLLWKQSSGVIQRPVTRTCCQAGCDSPGPQDICSSGIPALVVSQDPPEQALLV